LKVSASYAAFGSERKFWNSGITHFLWKELWLFTFIVHILSDNIKGIEGNRPLGRPRHGWEDKIKIDLKRLSFEVVD
jgi:hypothetical protein